MNVKKEIHYEINDLKEKESDDEINVPEVNDDYINEEISKKDLNFL